MKVMGPTAEPADLASEIPSAPGRVQWWIDTVLKNADALRNAGVGAIAIGECSVTLLAKPPPTPSFEPVKNDDLIPEGLPPLLDPHSYPGGVVPGFPKIERYVLEE